MNCNTNIYNFGLLIVKSLFFYAIKNFAHHPFFNCWFLSLPQILEVINISNDNNSFYENFQKTKFVTFNTLDWYKEFDLVTQMKDEKK